MTLSLPFRKKPLPAPIAFGLLDTDGAVLRDTEVLVLDKPEVTHRISTVKQADVVIVLEAGRITQMGTHAQLMEQEGHYRDIANVQLYGDEEMPAAREDSPSHMDRLRDPRGLQPVGARDEEKRSEEELV